MQWRLEALDGGDPVDYLTTLGILSCSPGTTVRFTESRQPILNHPGPESLLDAVMSMIETTLWPEHFPWPDRADLRSTTPAWSALKPLAEDSWRHAPTDRLVRTFDLGSSKQAETSKQPLDPQVQAASLVLISGRSYLRKSLQQIWSAPYRDGESVSSDDIWVYLRKDFHALLDGERPHASYAAKGNALRLSAAEPSPRLTTGIESSLFTQLTELLAFLGTVTLLPSQRDHTGRRGMTWTLPQVPMTCDALIDLHESGQCPDGWKVYSASVRLVGEWSKTSEFVDIGPVEKLRSNLWKS